MTDNGRRELRVASIAEPVSHYTDAVVHGDLVFVSGCIGNDTAGKIVDPDVAVQARQALANVSDILAAAGSSVGNILKVTVFVTDMADRAAINVVRQEVFGTARPASTLVEVSALAVPGAKVEVEAVACIPAGTA
jgi:2-iminobutanoate/2-iminopropanoate deaminase